jgi:hypothetical protein
MDFFTEIGFPVWIGLKVVVLVFLVVYLIFSVVLIRQVRLMTATLEVGFEKPVIALAFFHFFFAIGVFLFTIFVA